MSKMRIALLTVIVLLISMILFMIFTASPDPRCMSSEIHRTYGYSLQDDEASCTFLQQFTSTTEIFFIWPIVVTFPAGLVVLVFGVYKLIRQRQWLRRDRDVFVIYFLTIWGFAACAAAFFSVAGHSQN